MYHLIISILFCFFVSSCVSTSDAQKSLITEFYQKKHTASPLIKLKEKENAFHFAVKEGSSSLLRYLLEKQRQESNFNQLINGGIASPLFRAIENEDEQLVDLLLDYGADSNIGNMLGLTPVMLAVLIQDELLLNKLINHGAEVNKKDIFGRSALGYINIGVQQCTDDVSERLVHKLVEAGANPNEYFSKGSVVGLLANYQEQSEQMLVETTPISAALNNNAPKTLSRLLTSGGNVNDYIENGLTPLMKSVVDNNTVMFDIILSAEPDLNRQTEHQQWSVLHFLSTPYLSLTDEVRLTMANTIIAKGADVNLRSSNGKTPLFFAVQNNLLDMAKLLLDAGAKHDLVAYKKNEFTPLVVAVDRTNLAMVELLLQPQYKIDVNQLIDGRNALHYLTNKKKISSYLLHDQFVDVSVGYKHFPVHFIQNQPSDENEIAKLLIKSGVNLNGQNKDGYTPIHQAVKSGSLRLYNLFIDNGADTKINANRGVTLLMSAAKKSSFLIIRSLVMRGHKGDGVDYRNRNVFHYLAESYSSITRHNFELLVSSDINMNLQSNDTKDSPIHVALKKKSDAIAYRIFEAGGDINLTNNNKETALMLAAQAGKLSFVRSVIKKVKNINSVDKNGNSVLHYLSRYENFSSVSVDQFLQLLIDSGADISLMNNQQQTALDVANKSNNSEVAKALNRLIGS